MRYALLLVVLLLCALASTSVSIDAPWQVSVPLVGAFLVFAPGLLAVHLLELPDRLLNLVVGMLVGPSLWVLVGTLQLFTGLWDPRATVLVGAGVVGLVTLALAVSGVRRESAPVAPDPVPDVSRVERYGVDDSE